MGRTIETEIAIAAPADRVWSVLTEFDAYPEWNPFLVAVEGRPEVGSRLRIRFAGADGRSFRFRPTVLVAEPPLRLEWLGRAGVRGVFDGHHRFLITPIDAGHCRLVQGERFTGAMVPIVWRFVSGETRAGFEAMNEAMRSRCES